MGMFDKYKYEREPRVEKGTYWAELCDVEVGNSKKSGTPMITVTIRLNAHPAVRIKDFIVQNEFFNTKISKLCDCFAVEPEDEKLMTWPGAIGAVVLKEDGEFMRVAKYIDRKEVNKVEGLAQWEGPMPERQEISTIPRSDAFSPEDDGLVDLPF